MSRRDVLRYAAAATPAVLGMSALSAVVGMAAGTPQASAAPLGVLLDYAAGVINAAELRASGALGAIRYVSDRRPGGAWMLGKPIQIAEARDLYRSGLKIVSCYQYGKQDTADWLAGEPAGIQHAQRDNRGEPLALDPHSEEARKLVSYGMAEIVAGKVVMVDAAAAEILARSPDRLLYVRALLRFVEAADDSVDDLAKAFVTSLTELYRERVGTNYLPKPEEMDELRQVVQDYRALGEKAMAARFDQATRRYMVTSASQYTAGILLSGEWEPSKSVTPAVWES